MLNDNKNSSLQENMSALCADLFRMHLSTFSSDTSDELQFLFAFSLIYKRDLAEMHKSVHLCGARDADKINVAVNSFFGRAELNSAQPATVRKRSKAVVKVSNLSSLSPSGVCYRTGLVILPDASRNADDVEALFNELDLEGVPVVFHGPTVEHAFQWVLTGQAVDPALLEDFLDH
ncbi:hypothetical protein [Devosia rhizoryzae]|uniref:Uncharacterized protein n=1 Tax=Devosia rhizoryzae TaxID=2774137 RepID=A0ABX7C5H4_9HYPH|nr:hypothetical protein [Devosia rhizoryzae]QQR39028.1 hypothetical protein JI748_14990 [Devosia rhizoryzae]